jgi:hypothetical protein
MTTLERPGVPVGGFKTVGQIHPTNDLVFRENQNAMGVAVELLATHTPGALLNLPVKRNGKVAYSITRHDLLRAWIGLGVDIEDVQR